MSSLLARLKSDQIAARKAKSGQEVTFLSVLIGEASAFATAGKERRDVTDEDVIKAATKMEKSLKETRGLTKDETVIASIDYELAIAKRYLPVQMSEDQLRAAIMTIRSANSGANKGLIMKALKDAHSGSYDGKLAASMVDQVLVS